jgi:HPt (histidine-containing phosphotransfer) domain-containing protein
MPERLDLIDLPKLRTRCLDDDAFVRQMLSIFIEAAPQTLARLRDAVIAANAADVRRHAHTLKGSAANLSAEALRGAAAELESTAETATPEALRTAAARLQTLMDQSIAEAQRLRAGMKPA